MNVTCRTSRTFLTFLTFLTCLTALTACAREPLQTSQSLSDALENPLYADRYFKELVTEMVDLEIKEQEWLTGSGMEATVIRAKERALERAKLAEQEKRQGLFGAFVPVKAEPVGQVLLLSTKLYVGTDFLTDPGPSLRVYLSTVIDPRDVTFPDDSAVDLGPLKSAYGAHDYDVTTTTEATQFRTVTLYDTRLKRIYGFAQLNAQ